MLPTRDITVTLPRHKRFRRFLLSVAHTRLSAKLSSWDPSSGGPRFAAGPDHTGPTAHGHHNGAHLPLTRHPVNTACRKNLFNHSAGRATLENRPFAIPSTFFRMRARIPQRTRVGRPRPCSFGETGGRGGCSSGWSKSPGILQMLEASGALPTKFARGLADLFIASSR